MPGSSGRPISIGRAERCPWRRLCRGDFGGAALSLICGGEWGSGSVADPWTAALPMPQACRNGGAAPAAAGGGEARAAGTGEAAKPPLRPRFCTFIKAWERGAGAPQRGGLPAGPARLKRRARPTSCAPGFVPLSKHRSVGRAHRSGEGCPQGQHDRSGGAPAHFAGKRAGAGHGRGAGTVCKKCE